ncbi:MAG: restriction endonuclease [Campylobacterales bacterium]|nr:restriction endonuclease [Campylobacterales bacterium]
MISGSIKTKRNYSTRNTETIKSGEKAFFDDAKRKAQQSKKKTSYKEKVAKGCDYEAFVSDYYKAQGYVVYEHGKEKGREDGGIDIIVMKDKMIYFLQCKNWSENHRYKITHKDIKVFRTEARDFITSNGLFEARQDDIRLRFVVSGNILDKSALYALEGDKNLDYEILKMNNDDYKSTNQKEHNA